MMYWLLYPFRSCVWWWRYNPDDRVTISLTPEGREALHGKGG